MAWISGATRLCRSQAVYLEPIRSKWAPCEMYQAFRCYADMLNNMLDSGSLVKI